MMRRQKFERFFETMPYKWTKIQALAQMADLPIKSLAHFLAEARKYKLVQYRKVQIRGHANEHYGATGIKTCTGEWKKVKQEG